MSRSLEFLLTATLVGLGTAQPAFAAPATAEDLAVLRAVLAPECGRSDPGYHLLSTRAASVDMSDQVPSDWPEADALTAQLRARAESRGSWSGVRICPKVLVRRDGDIERLIENAPNLDAGWKKFYSAYPGARGVIRVSLPAYSGDGNRAVVFTGEGCGSLCGSGDVIELEKKDGVWHRTRAQATWIS